MAELFGTISAAVGLAEALLSLTEKLAACVDNIRHAPQQVHDFKRETSIFSSCLNSFRNIAEEVCRDVEDLPPEINTAVDAVIQQAKMVKRGIQHMLHRVRGLQSLSVMRSWIARVRWYMQQTPMKALLPALNSAKLNVILITSILSYAHLKQKIENVTSSEEFDSLQSRVYDT